MSEWMDRPSTEAVEKYERKLRHRKRIKHVFTGVLAAMLVLVVACTVVLTTVAKPYRMTGNAMEPTLSDGCIVLVVSLDGAPLPGDIVVSEQRSPEGLQLIRRVIATAGSTVAVDRSSGAVTVDGTTLDEPYVSTLSPGNMDANAKMTVPTGYVYVLGDERASALDSRSEEIGLVAVDSVKGKVVFKLPSF